ncbi:MAG: Phosphoribosylformimino-5-aminoimidazole carboxamide ribotide isomerase [Rhodanobacteraceae bacterium]|jgi:phosphoribosylformimino-5-aminoimidazole carboxamide ribotide isomerase|nr:MAG: Phosphoribosylformimino-5-aminoimidazole carboxamide ribotide isomerase [Rhodanobacteraceae bacterium]
MSFQVIPAIDLRGGRVVRLRQGDYARETVFADDPVELARGYADEGAQWLHVVDLDGARSGKFANLAVIEAIARTGTLKVQAGGGVRTTDDLRRLYSAGVTRVVVGSLAVQNPYATAIWITQFEPDRLVLALDVRRQAGAWRLPVHGWTEDSCVQLDTLAAHYARAGARHVLCTDIARDGTLGGFNLELYRDLHRFAPDFEIQASGGACSLDDVRKVRAAGVRAVILGRALLERKFTLKEALKC